jgi:hypothetical protein
MKYGLLLTLSASAILLSACSGGGSDTPPPPATAIPSIGVFIDSAVSGLQYKTASRSGYTNSAGEYEYLPGETVSFSIGGIDLGSATADAVLSPLSLIPDAQDVTDIRVTNIVRLLMSIDEDADASNGITITGATDTAATTLKVDFTSADLAADAGVTSLLASLPESGPLVDAAKAQNHLTTSLSQWGNLVWGSGKWQAKLTLKDKPPK